MKALFGAINTVVGGAVHVASGTLLCRTCGKLLDQGDTGARCQKCRNRGR